MRTLGGAALILALSTFSSPIWAQSIPAVLLNSSNQTPACATPGRLTSFLKFRNPALRSRFDKIAVYYMKHGEALNIRWDFAFFQMLMETNSLKFTGDVNWTQNNFAGLGATGGGVQGERFASVSDGVRAHLEHLLIYAGVRVDNPIAERTRNVQSWNILTSWQRSIRGPMTFGHIGKKWAPGDRDYAQDIKSIADRFYMSFCNRQDPAPQLIAEARGASRQLAAQTVELPLQDSVTSLAFPDRASLGASTVYRRPGAPGNVVVNRSAEPLQRDDDKKAVTAAMRDVTQTQAVSAPRKNASVEIINLPTPSQDPSEASGNSRTDKDNAAQQAAKAKEQLQTTDVRKPQESGKAASSIALGAKFATPFINPTSRQNDTQQSKIAQKSLPSGQVNPAETDKTAARPKKCRVWTASYGGQKAIIIRSSDKTHTNYTVLDVNPDRERQETTAYIAAYAKGGQKIHEFDSQTRALDEAFKLCPEG